MPIRWRARPGDGALCHQPVVGGLRARTAVFPRSATTSGWRTGYASIAKGAYLWHVRLDNAQAGQLEPSGASTPVLPRPGSIIISDSEHWEAVTADPRRRRDRGRQGIRLMIAAGAGVPLHYLAEGDSATRATAREMGTTLRRFAHRQFLFESILTDLIRGGPAGGVARPLGRSREPALNRSCRAIRDDTDATDDRFAKEEHRHAETDPDTGTEPCARCELPGRRRVAMPPSSRRQRLAVWGVEHVLLRAGARGPRAGDPLRGSQRAAGATVLAAGADRFGVPVRRPRQTADLRRPGGRSVRDLAGIIRRHAGTPRGTASAVCCASLEAWPGCAI